MTNLKGATRHKICYGIFGTAGECCLYCPDTKVCRKATTKTLNRPKKNSENR